MPDDEEEAGDEEDEEVRGEEDEDVRGEEGEEGEEEGDEEETETGKVWLRGISGLPKPRPATEEEKWLIAPQGKR